MTRARIATAFDAALDMASDGCLPLRRALGRGHAAVKDSRCGGGVSRAMAQVTAQVTARAEAQVAAHGTDRAHGVRA